MGSETLIQWELDSIDEETLRWLHEFPSWKRRKAERPEDVTIRFLLDYMAARLYDYYFIQRNYSALVPLLEAYARDYGQVQGVVRLIEDVRIKLGK
jgi:hypothetical protein